METTVSSKYQIVIPKAARKQLGLKPGQKLQINSVTDTEITLSMPLTAEQIYKKFAGSLKDSLWKQEGIDAAVWMRRQRDRDWD